MFSESVVGVGDVFTTHSRLEPEETVGRYHHANSAAHPIVYGTPHSRLPHASYCHWATCNRDYEESRGQEIEGERGCLQKGLIYIPESKGKREPSCMNLDFTGFMEGVINKVQSLECDGRAQ